ncbi:MAG: DUF1223 domain-containing protein [Pseudomonadota bacterium]
MSKFVRFFAGALVALLPLGAMAQNNLVMVELYTSQGCSSCPPADAFLGQLDTREDVLALAFHVDYWDYLGWKDEFGKASHTKRQRTYAALGKRRSIFTPEMIIGGSTSLVGHAKRKINAELKAQAATAPLVRLGLQQTQGSVVITLSPISQTGPATVYLVSYQPKTQVAIKKGENRGHRLTYHNVVLDLVPLGKWSGTGEAQFEATPQNAQARHAVFVQAAPQGAILAAAKVN